nr:MAG TPA: Spc7 kinetochore protein [Caudoviricetes sp.]
MHKFHELIREIKSSPDFYDIIYDLSEMLDEKMMVIKALNEDMYEDIMTCVYVEIHGEHFDECLAKKGCRTDAKCRWYNW